MKDWRSKSVLRVFSGIIFDLDVTILRYAVIPLFCTTGGGGGDGVDSPACIELGVFLCFLIS